MIGTLSDVLGDWEKEGFIDKRKKAGIKNQKRKRGGEGGGDLSNKIAVAYPG